MSNIIEYEKALEISRNYLNNLVGYSKYEGFSTTDQIIIKQNNLIINLLEQMVQKLNLINSTLSKQTSLSLEIGEILDKIKNMKIGDQSTIKKTLGHTFGTKIEK